MAEKLPASVFELLDQLDRENVTGYQRYNRVKRYMQFKAREKGVPVCGTFELTPLCNLDCRMCYVHLNRDQLKGQPLLDVETWKSLFDQAIEAGLMYATLTGGECLTYPGFRELYLHLRRRGVDTHLLTNGILLTDEMVSFLSDNPPAGIQITLYGAGEEEYERVTGHRSFRKVMAGIKRVQDAHIPLSIAVTPSAYMTQGKDLIQLLYSLGLSYSINSGLKQPREATGRGLNDASLDTYVELYRENHRLGGGKPLTIVPDEDLPDPGNESTLSSQARGVRCAAGRSSFCLCWDGTMRPCNSFPDIAENVLQVGFQTAWERIRKAVGEIPLPVECSDCAYEKVCKNCILEHLGRAPAGHANPAVCSYVRRFVKEGFIKV